jgi:hypothetical protein
MAARLWTALLMLAAVFAMHGLQCTTAAAGSTHGSGAVHAATVAPAASAADGRMTGVGLTDPMPGDSAVTRSDADAPADAGRGSTPHGAGVHLWTLCLAVLAAGFAVLLALLVPRLFGLVPPALRRARAHAAGWSTPLRPPDLFALCVLRT